jgi:hypothetical protein
VHVVRRALFWSAVFCSLSGCGLVLDVDSRQGVNERPDGGVLVDAGADAPGDTSRDSNVTMDGGRVDGSRPDSTIADATRPDASTGDAVVSADAMADGATPLRGFGEGCATGGNAVCESGICETLWDGYFCYYTACNIACDSDSDCEAVLRDLGISGFGHCNGGGSTPATCDLRDLMLGDVVCE